MTSLNEFSLDLVVFFSPVLVVCWWVFFRNPVNWFINAKSMEQRTDFFIGKGKFWVGLYEKLSLRGWRNRFYCNYLGSKKVRETWWRKLLLLWVVGWFLGSLWIFWFMNSQAAEKRRETLASMCDERARMLQDQFNVSMNHLQALAILVSTFHHSKDPSAIDQVLNSGLLISCLMLVCIFLFYLI